MASFITYNLNNDPKTYGNAVFVTIKICKLEE